MALFGHLCQSGAGSRVEYAAFGWFCAVLGQKMREIVRKVSLFAKKSYKPLVKPYSFLTN